MLFAMYYEENATSGVVEQMSFAQNTDKQLFATESVLQVHIQRKMKFFGKLGKVNSVTSKKVNA